VFTSTTSLMVRAEVRAGAGPDGAWWMDESFAPLSPRNIYGATKLAAESLCSVMARDTGMAVAILRTSRFFSEQDDTIGGIAGENLKANEFLNRRLSVADCAEAHVAALERSQGCETYVISAPPPFAREDAPALATDAPAVIAARFPEAAALYGERGWRLPERIERVYDPGKAERVLGWRAGTDFGAILDAMRDGDALPFIDDPGFVSPILSRTV
jgi:nucleoside-diphosphate-sugar epimerase